MIRYRILEIGVDEFLGPFPGEYYFSSPEQAEDYLNEWYVRPPDFPRMKFVIEGSDGKEY